LRDLWYKIVRLYVKLGLLFYFKKIHVYGVDNIPKDQPILFVSNHRNGLIDPILIGVTSQRIHIYLTRASAFKNSIANSLLRSINMLPVYRVRDGLDSINKNHKIFNNCFDYFHKKGTVQIFPEGNHGLPRRLRRLSKGFTRIAFGYIDKYKADDLLIIPVGMNYQKMQEKGSMVSIYYGKPIQVIDFYNPSNEKQAIDSLKEKVSTEIKKISTHIEDLENHEKIEKVLISKGIDFLDPFKANETIKKTTNWNEPVSLAKQKTSVYQTLLKIAFTINTLLPILYWNSVKNKIKDPVLIPTFRFGLGLGIFPLYYFLQSLLVGLLSGFYWGITYLIVSVLLVFLYKNSIQTDSFTTIPS
jgi:1-acyl-sn-glycerol-3-phosphate acyltransferase